MLPSVIIGLLLGPLEAPEPAPRAIMAAIQSIEVSQGDAGKAGLYQQGFQLALSAERGRAARPDYPLVAEPLLRPGSRVVVTVTIKARPQVLFDGVITHQQLAGDDEPVLTVTGRDLSQLMDMVEAGARRPGQGDKEAALAIIGAYAAYGIRPAAADPATSAPATEEQRVPIQAATDLKHLRALAAANDFVFYLRAGPAPKQSRACWGPKLPKDQAQPALTTRMGAGTNVSAISFSYDALAPAQLFGAYADPDKEEPADIQALEQKGGAKLSKSPALTPQATFLLKRRIYDTPFSAAQALALAQSRANSSAARTLVVKGKLDTARYGHLLFAPGTVGVRGAGASYDGEYCVETVTHKITPDGYAQEFQLSREGVGAAAEKVKVQ